MHSNILQVHFHFAVTPNSKALSGVAIPRLASHVPLIAQFHAALKAEVTLNNKHKNKWLVKFCHCHVGGV